MNRSQPSITTRCARAIITIITGALLFTAAAASRTKAPCYAVLATQHSTTQLSVDIGQQYDARNTRVTLK